MGIERLRGKTLVYASMTLDKTMIVFVDSTGVEWWLHHHQTCCEHVVVNDIEGDLTDLIGAPIVMAESVSDHKSRGHAPDLKLDTDTFTWTFYKLATLHGYVTIRWIGKSNGCYAEDVDFCKSSRCCRNLDSYVLRSLHSLPDRKRA